MILQELWLDVSSLGVARQYVGLCDIFIIDEIDVSMKESIESLGMEVFVTKTVMQTNQEKKQLAEFILDISK